MKKLNGLELAEYIKERQAKQVRNLRQSHGIFPKLAIIQTLNSPVIDTYIRLKRRYGEDILVEVERFFLTEEEAFDKINELNNNENVQGIIVQLPLSNESWTDKLVNAVDPKKDVDSLGNNAIFDPATPVAINWLLAGSNVDLKNKKITIVGKGRLVGAPLLKMWINSGLNVTAVDEATEDIKQIIATSDVIVSATGVPGLITSEMIRPSTVIVDAGTTSESGRIVGDVADDVLERHDLLTTPRKGGVGPLTICALFDNLIRACRLKADDIC